MPIFQSLIKKEILHLLRDFRTVTVVLVIPVVLLLCLPSPPKSTR